MALRRCIGDVAARVHILGFIGTAQTVLALPKGQSMCTSLYEGQRRGTPFCCRCAICEAPLGDHHVLLKLRRKAGRGRTCEH